MITFKIKIFQGNKLEKKCFCSRCHMHGDGNGCELMKQMQPSGNLPTTWIMFDHVNRVKGWRTFTCHVYDSFYCKVMIIAICDMQFENMEA